MKRNFCDQCKNELTQNMVTDRLVVEIGKFKAVVLISKDGKEGDGDLCYGCLMKMLNQKPKRKYTKKPKPERVIPPEPNLIKALDILVPKAAINQAQKEIPTPERAATIVMADPAKWSPLPSLPDISTFSIKTDPNGPYILSLGEASIASIALREGVIQLLGAVGIDQAYVKDAPDSEGKRNLLNILEEGD